VEHDLVFPVVAVLPQQLSCLSIDREKLIYGEMGRVFNPLSQIGGLYAMDVDTEAQRSKLWAFLEYELQNLDERAADQACYKSDLVMSLLRLTRALLPLGFFEVESRTTKGDLPVQSSPPATTTHAMQTPAKTLHALINHKCWDWESVLESKRLSYETLEVEIASALMVLGNQAVSCGSPNHDQLDFSHSTEQSYNEIFYQIGPISLKTELLATLRILRQVRCMKVKSCWK